MIETALDMLLMHYAAGSLEPAEALMAAVHVSLNPEARKKLSRYEAVGGNMMNDMPCAAVSADCLNAVLALIDAPAAATAARRACPAQDCALPLPDHIHDLLDSACNSFALAWQPQAEGIEVIDLCISAPTPCSRKLSLLRLHPHRAAPHHSHEGLEITVVLGGSYRDATGRYKTGDIVIIDDTTFSHAPQAEEDGCLCLTLTDGAIRFGKPEKQGFFAHFFKRF